MTRFYFCIFLMVPLFATAVNYYPRTVLSCAMTEGSAGLFEDGPGAYSYKGSYGFDGTSAGGAAKIGLTKQAGKCILKVSAGEGPRKISRSFSWTIDPNGAPNSISEGSAQDGVCGFKLRYSKSFAQCVLPTPTEPGSQCHGEGGQDLTALFPSGSPVLQRKLVGFSGGMTIEIDPGSQRGISVWRDPKDGKSWCYQLKTLFPDQCKKLTVRQEIKNSEGQIVGILEPQADQVSFRQAKQPYTENGYKIDSSAPSVLLKNSKTETNVIALGDRDSELGRITIEGDIDLPTRLRSFNKPAVNIINGGPVTSDCNGLVQSGSSQGGLAPVKSGTSEGSAR